ncbi:MULTISPECIES: HEPN domain-containing protein [Pseudanabaena]|uniref:Uncharacterized protein n=1 Tax=Pseudanabaena biceps PCC 7429 TaxID=927668 RepID=L8N2I5_9CYAN|nr:HEPN domain-containing protein [Pseudanabaena biceps]ELS33254.1 hypothetical protein Pse7429DRAFT_1593 [Pseudanabaena biceps PCC 7429]
MLSLHFVKTGVKTGKINPSIADLLREAYDARQACDYESDMTEDEEMAKNAIANAQTFISEIKIWSLD